MARNTVAFPTHRPHPYYRQRENVGSSQLEEHGHSSECVASTSYDPERQEMTINFNKRGSYAYFDVPPWLFAEFNNAASRGTYFNLYIRGNYAYDRISS